MRTCDRASARLGSLLLCVIALSHGCRAQADPLYTIVDLGPQSSSPTIPASLATAAQTALAGAVMTVPVYATPSTQDPIVPLGPVGSDAEFVLPSGNVIHIGLPDSGWNSASAINNLGQAVGTTLLDSGDPHAFVYTNGQTLDLNHLIPLLGNWTITSAINIDEDGRILADAVSGGVDHTVILLPQAIPEPSTLAIGILLICGAGLFRAFGMRSGGEDRGDTCDSSVPSLERSSAPTFDEQFRCADRRVRRP
jgi:probable HAF family extracellular repeat protein